jgi:hypothetical protein
VTFDFPQLWTFSLLEIKLSGEFKYRLFKPNHFRTIKVSLTDLLFVTRGDALWQKN